MRLAKLTLVGFKSFADRTDIVFNNAITGIVGPNGCGKSNVVDAIKWVLGSLSPKSLRGDAMMDMIFNGSSTRKPSGMASVSLTFDNPVLEDGSRKLPVETDQVVVTRQLYRDGSSEYLINKKRARLRDIKELFMDTGIGTEAYSVIEQGKVARMLEANAAQRRQIFEEAAGISRFKARKIEALRKLERTEQNLTVTRQRLEDNQKRLRSVKVQAGRARTHQELTARLRELQLNYALAEYHKYTTQLAETGAELEQAEADRAAAARKLGEAEQTIADAQIERRSVEQRLKQLEHERLQQQSQQEQAEQRRRFALSTLQELRQRIERDTQRRDELTERCAQLQREHDEQVAQAEQLQGGRQSAEQQLQEAQQRDRALQHELNDKRSELEDVKAGIITLMRRTAELNNQIKSIEAFQQNLTSTRAKLDQRAAEVAERLERLLTMRDELTAKRDEAQALVDAQSAKLDELKSQAAELSQEQRELSEKLANAKEKRSGLESRRQLLQQMQDEQEGVADPVKAVLARKAAEEDGAADDDEAHHGGDVFHFVRGMLADMLETDVDNAAIVEAALGEYQQALVLDRLSDICTRNGGQHAIEALAGRVTFLSVDHFGPPLGWLPQPRMGIDAAADSTAAGGSRGFTADDTAGSDASASTDDGEEDTFATEQSGSLAPSPGPSLEAAGPESAAPTSVLDLVTFPAEIAPLVWRLLGRTLIVDDLLEARALRAKLPNGYRFVTLGGELLETDGRVNAGSAGAVGEVSTGLISRRSELAQLKAQLESLDAVIAADQQTLAQLSDRAAHIEGVSQELRQTIYDANTARVELTSRLQSVNDQIESLEREQPVISAETEQVHRQLRDADVKRDSHQQEATKLERDASERQESIQALESSIAELSSQAEAAREAVTSQRVELSKLAEQLASAQRHARQSEIALADMRRQHKGLDEQLAHAGSRIDELEQSAEQAQQESLRAGARLDQLEAALEEMNAAMARVDEQLEAIRADVTQHRRTVEAADRTLHNLQMRRRELEVKSEGVCQRAQEQLNLDVVEAYGRAVEEGEKARDEETERSRDGETEGAVDEGMRGDSDVECEATEVAAPGGALFSIDWSAVEEEVNDLRRRLERLGNVNLDAIEELSQLEDRDRDLAVQVEDIDQARVKLIQLIKQINDDSRTRFEETFNRIREHFAGQNGLFRRLFGGGRADIFMQPDEQGNIDVLESGIEIIAKPPGKEPQSISLLSGGEKTMTAVALLLSIFQTRPSPFAILDEVDAALDEANVHRFANILQSFLDRSHFIVITHNKATMQACDMLYGITMQERGVSKRVSVAFDQVRSDGSLTKEALDKHEAQTVAEAEPPQASAHDEDDHDNGHGRDAHEADSHDDDDDHKPSMRKRLAAMFDSRQTVEVDGSNN